MRMEKSADVGTHFLSQVPFQVTADDNLNSVFDLILKP